MNIICHITYGSLIYEFKFIGYGSFILTILIGGIYLFICIICLHYALSGGQKTIFYVLYNLWKILEDSKTLQDIIGHNRKINPKININATVSHKESREVWDEYAEYNKPGYKTENTEVGPVEEFDHYETEERYVKTLYSEWGRVDKGGGKFFRIPGKNSDKYVKKLNIKQ